MPKLLVLSDLHLESNAFEPDAHAMAAADVVVLAGDIQPGDGGIRWAREVFGDKPIIYVAGNHEFYGGEWRETLDLMRETAKTCDVHFLENDTVTLAGVRFLGCTLWTDFAYFGTQNKAQLMRHAQLHFADYRAINAFSHAGLGRLTASMTWQRHQTSRAWLEAELPKGEPAHTVVVTHHYSHENSTAPRWRNDRMTAAFGSQLPPALLLQAGLWIHGHVHSSVDFRLGGQVQGIDRDVRVVCNPRGYPVTKRYTEVENPAFNAGLLMALLPDGNWAEFYEL